MIARCDSAAGRLLGIAACLLAAGCSDWQGARTAAVGDHRVAIKTEPQPPRVGSAAEVAVRVTAPGGGPAPDCRVNMRQSMPGMQMRGDRIEVVMEARGDGVYRGRSREFTMGGDWRITVALQCPDGATGEAAFDYHLEWPQ